jgi:hypothetical protein
MRALFLAAMLCASPAVAAPCDHDCKVRITACRAAEPARCVTEDKFPERAGICAFMVMGVVAEWINKNPGFVFRVAECVTPDDQKV